MLVLVIAEAAGKPPAVVLQLLAQLGGRLGIDESE
jgi:hypothetical protein